MVIPTLFLQFPVPRWPIYTINTQIESTEVWLFVYVYCLLIISQCASRFSCAHDLHISAYICIYMRMAIPRPETPLGLRWLTFWPLARAARTTLMMMVMMMMMGGWRWAGGRGVLRVGLWDWRSRIPNDFWKTFVLLRLAWPWLR